MQSVCIVGAGPAGLVAAKTFLQTGFKVTIFEKADRIGGIWALDKHSTHGFLSPQTPTNLSRFTVSFSDLAWSSVLEGHLPLFPKAWQVNQYLEKYCQKYIPEGTIQLNTAVTAAARSESGWKITANDNDYQFNYLIVASGFFASPRPLERNIISSHLPIKPIHSTQFRSLRDLYPEEVRGNILIIGGGNSAGEAAAVIANQLSNAQWKSNPDQRFRHCKITHVTPRPFYAIPPFIPSDEESIISHHNFLPLDFSFYNLAKRLPPIQAGAGLQTRELRNILHGSVQRSLGGDQSDLGAIALVSPNDEDRSTAQAALTESYPEFVRSGLIEVLKGRVSSLQANGETISAIVDGMEIENIGAVLYATGYSPIPALEFLDGETKKALHFDTESLRLPLVLDQWQTSSIAIPDLAFHGFYEGPYWGIMEMQARLTAEKWVGNPVVKQRLYEAKDKMLELRQAMSEKRSDVPQYWLGDYLGYMEEIAAALHLTRNDGEWQEREGVSIPARYLLSGDDKVDADEMMIDAYKTWNACHAGKYAARAVFRGMQGNWEIHRSIQSRKNSYPSGELVGTASFHPRVPTADFDFEYVYVESGTFTTTTGVIMTASRRYAYRYCEARDELSVWFIKPDNDREVDYLFHNLTLSSTKEFITAKAAHLCINDMYETSYNILMKGIALQRFSVEHIVNGPEKDYTAITEYKRPKLS